MKLHTVVLKYGSWFFVDLNTCLIKWEYGKIDILKKKLSNKAWLINKDFIWNGPTKN